VILKAVRVPPTALQRARDTLPAEFERTPPPPGEQVEIERRLPLWRRALDHGGLRKTLILLALALAWELAAAIRATP
jgi:hypothetical protein